MYTECTHLKTAFCEPAIAFEEAMLVERYSKSCRNKLHLKEP